MFRTETAINLGFDEQNCAADESVSCSVVPLISQDPSVATENSMSSDSAESLTSSHPPLGDLKAMLQFLMAKDEKERKQREIERREREAKEERQRKEREDRERERRERWERERQERLDREERDRKEREAKEKIDREERARERKEREAERQKRFEEEQERDHRARLEFFQRVEQLDLQWAERSEKRSNLRFKKIEEALLAVAAARNVAGLEIKAEKSMMSEGASFDDMNDAEAEKNDSTWDGPQDKFLVRDVAIVSTEPAGKESAENVCSEVSKDGLTPLDSSQKICGNSSTLVGGKRSTPEPESPVVAYFENPSESEPKRIFQSPELGERTRNPDFESQMCEARLCDEILVDSLPMVFSAKNRSVTVKRIGVVQFLGKNSMNFSVVQCSNPYSDFWCGFGHDSVCSVSSCGSLGRQRFGSVGSVCSIHSSGKRKSGSIWSDDAGQNSKAVNSKDLRRHSGNQYYPVLTVQSSKVTCPDPRRYADAEFWDNPVFQSAQRGAELKGAGYNLTCIPMVMLKSNRYIALGANPGSIAMLPTHLPQPPGSQQVVIWSFKLEFGIT